MNDLPADLLVSTLRILLLEDSDLDAELLDAVLEDADIPRDIERVIGRSEFLAAISTRTFDIILADYVLPSFDGLSALRLANEICPHTPFVFVSGTLGEDVAVESLKHGATDYVTKQRLGRLPRAMLRALAETRAYAAQREAERELRRLNETLEARIADRTQALADANAELRRQIGERERVEEALRQAQRLEAIGQLTSGVAHDFNNLLTVITGNLDFLAPLAADEKSKRRLHMMRSAADSGARLTAQLLAFSRRQRLEPAPIELNHIVRSMRDLLQGSIGGSIRIDMRLQDDLWAALVDATQIELVILNLAINARDAMTVGGSLVIETANVVIEDAGQRAEEPQPGQYVMVAVNDTGVGIPPEIMSRVFEPFFTTKEIGKGSGLGLAQVYGFAKQSGGGVRIDTAIGQGTSVKVFLPRAALDAVGHATCGKATVKPSNARYCRRALLIVDDDFAVREVTAQKLTQAGYRVRKAESALAAIEALEADCDVDGVILDFAMPEMNGAEVAQEIQRRWGALPILFVTGYADVEALHRLESVGEDRIVQKPYRGGELEQKVAALIGIPAPGASADLAVVGVRD